MKANEAPEKIQVHLIKNSCDDWSIEGYSFLEDKQIGMTEYTRTDAFIERAVEWIKEKWDDNYTMPIIIDSVIEEFKNHMKGE